MACPFLSVLYYMREATAVHPAATDLRAVQHAHDGRSPTVFLTGIQPLCRKSAGTAAPSPDSAASDCCTRSRRLRSRCPRCGRMSRLQSLFTIFIFPRHMTPFDRFRQHVQDQPDAVAVITPYRVASYRKMWSRIERSTARLQAEWGILPGDTIAYLGCGHLDALVMYFAAARCGARVLPLEHAALQSAAPVLVAAAGCVLVLHDDALDISLGFPAGTLPGDAGVACRPLSTLIATPCRHREAVIENSAAVSLLQWPQAPGVQAGDTAADIRLLQGKSLDQLAAEVAVDAGTANATMTGDAASVSATRSFRHAMFDAEIFGPVVLATLLAGQTLGFGAA
jgi:hypothetical protein